MKKLFLFFIFLIHITALAQHKHSVNMFYGYSHYFSNEPYLYYPYNYNVGVNFAFLLSENFKLEIGSSYNTHNYVYRYYKYSPDGILIASQFMYVHVLKIPQIKFCYKILDDGTKNSFFITSGIEIMNISKATFKFQWETLNGEILFQNEDNITKDIKNHKQTGYNVLLGLEYKRKICDFFNVSFDVNGIYTAVNIWNLQNERLYPFDNSRFSVESSIGFEFIFK